jgi:hypothetical protein
MPLAFCLPWIAVLVILGSDVQKTIQFSKSCSSLVLLDCQLFLLESELLKKVLESQKPVTAVSRTQFI